MPAGSRGRPPGGPACSRRAPPAPSASPSGRRGSSTTNRVPPPGASSIQTRPPWRRTCSATRESPSPVPVARRPLAGPTASVEALEEVVALARRARPGPWSSTTTRMLVAGTVRGRRRDRRSTTTRVTPAGVERGVLHQVGHHPFEPPLVHPQAQALDPGSDLHGEGHRRPEPSSPIGAEARHRPPHQFAGVHLVERELGRAGVEPGDLQQVVDHPGEPLQVPVEEVEGAPGPWARARPGGPRAPPRWRSGW